MINRLSDFYQMVVYGTIMFAIFFSAAMIFSVIRLDDNLIEASIETKGISFTLDDDFNPDVLSSDIVSINGLTSLKNKARIDDDHFGNKIIESVSFPKVIPKGSSIRIYWEANNLIFLIKSTPRETTSAIPVSLGDIVVKTKENELSDLLTPEYFYMGSEVRIVIAPQLTPNMDSGSSYKIFSPFLISDIDFSADNLFDEKQTGVVKELESNMSLIEEGRLIFPKIDDKEVELKKYDPVVINVSVGVVENLSIRPGVISVNLTAKANRIVKKVYNFDSKADSSDRFYVKNLAPTLLDLILSRLAFDLSFAIISFVITLIGVFELFGIKGLFKRHQSKESNFEKDKKRVSKRL